MMTTSENTRRELDTLKLQWKPLLVSAAAVVILYFLAVWCDPGWFTYLLSSVSLVIIMVTALVRANLIGSERTEKRWHLRRFGLVLVGLASVWLILAPFGAVMDFPTWKETMLRWGFAISWLTTPGMPPWWRLVTGKFNEVDPATGKRHPLWHNLLDPDRRDEP